MEYIKLNEICSLKQWQTIPTKNLIAEGYPVYGANGIIGFYNKYNHETPTIMICCRGATCGAVNVSYGKCYINGNAMALDNLSKDYDLDFVAFYLRHYDFSNIITGAAQPQITQIGLDKVFIPKLSLSHQIKISSYFKKVENSINTKKTELLSLDELVKSRFIEMFGDVVRNDLQWETDKLSTLCPVKNYRGEIPSLDGKYWLLNLDLVESNTGAVLAKNYVDFNEIGNSTITFSQEYVLYSKLRPYLNKVVLPDGIGYATSELVPFLPSDKINKYYLAYALRSDNFVALINDKSGGAKMPRAPMDFVKAFPLPIPPISLQNEFADFVKLIDKSKFVCLSILRTFYVKFARFHPPP